MSVFHCPGALLGVPLDTWNVIFFVVSCLRFAGLSAAKRSRWPQGVESSVMLFVVSICLEMVLQSLLLRDFPVGRQHRWLRRMVQWELAVLCFGCNMIVWLVSKTEIEMLCFCWARVRLLWLRAVLGNNLTQLLCGLLICSSNVSLFLEVAPLQLPSRG